MSARVFRALEETGALAEAAIATVAQRRGVSHAALNALAVIEGNGGPIAVGEVSAAMHITSATMTGVLDTLTRNGYVERLADPDDRRRVLVEVTPSAQALLDALLPEVVQMTTAAVARVDEADLGELLRLLEVVRAAIVATPTELSTPPARRTPPHLRRS